MPRRPRPAEGNGNVPIARAVTEQSHPWQEAYDKIFVEQFISASIVRRERQLFKTQLTMTSLAEPFGCSCG